MAARLSSCSTLIAGVSLIGKMEAEGKQASQADIAAKIDVVCLQLSIC